MCGISAVVSHVIADCALIFIHSATRSSQVMYNIPTRGLGGVGNGAYYFVEKLGDSSRIIFNVVDVSQDCGRELTY